MNKEKKEKLMVTDDFILSKDFKLSKSMEKAVKEAIIGRVTVYENENKLKINQ